MTTFADALAGLSTYPIHVRTLAKIGAERGLDIFGVANMTTLSCREYKLTQADVLMWLAFAPNLSQDGQTFSFSDAQREMFRRRAEAIYKEMGESGKDGVVFGYKGSRL